MAKNSKYSRIGVRNKERLNGLILFDPLNLRNLGHVKLFFKKMLGRSGGIRGLRFLSIDVDGKQHSYKNFERLKISEETGIILTCANNMDDVGEWCVVWSGETKNKVSKVFKSDGLFLEKIEELGGDFALVAFEKKNPEKLYLYRKKKPLFVVFSFQWSCYFFSAFKENMITDDDILTLRPFLPIPIFEKSALMIDRSFLTRAEKS